VTETTKDGALTTYSYDALGDVTNRAMPGGLTWKAAYLSDGRIFSEQETGGSLTSRSMSYTYYSSGTSSAGRLQTVTDGRGTVRTNTYDDFMRLATVNTGGGTTPQQSSTSYTYDPSGDLLSVGQSFANNNNSTFVMRLYDGYHRVVEEDAGIDETGLGLSEYTTGNMTWDLAGRRSGLNFGPGGFTFAYQADGQMTSVNGATFGYGNNGLLTGRTNSVRSYTVNQRDGKGRLLQATTSANSTTLLGEVLTWRNDGRLTNYIASRSDSTETTDTRKYSYSALAQRLTQESFNVASAQSVTNIYTIDNGSTGGLGILTSQAQSGTLSDTWSVPSSGGLDGLSRVAKSTDTVITRPAYGNAVGAATVTATLDSKPVSVQFDGPNSSDGTWRASLSLFPGSHTLSVSAVDPSGQYSATTNNSFTANGGATDTITNVYDGNGNVTQRIWVSSSGVTNRIQNLTYDAFDRLISVTDRDAQNSGLNWTALYDPLGRRLQTTSTVVVSNTPVTSPPDAVSTVQSFYDPLAEFLEVATLVNDNVLNFKTYGPDASGTYGELNGVGGLDALNTYGHTTTLGVVQDVFGNVLASISNSVVTWNPTRVSSYGPFPGYESPALSLNVGLEQSLGWRGKRVDETGLVYMGARHYDPTAGRFTSADPLGHAGSMDLYSFAGGDPVNFFDPSGRFGKMINDQYQGLVDNYNNAQQIAQSEGTYADSNWHYADENDASLGQWSALVDMIPVVGGLKQWYELNTGKDAFTGAWLQGNDYLQAFGIVANFAPVAFGPAALLEGGGEGAFIGAGEQGLMEAAAEEEAVTAENVVAADAVQGKTAAVEATFGPDGQMEFGFANELSPAPVSSTMQQMTFDFGGAGSQSVQNVGSEAVQLELNFTARGSLNPQTQAASLLGSALHADQPGNLPMQLRSMFPETQFSFTPSGQPGQDVQVIGGMHPSAYPYGNWPQGVDFGDFKPNTPGGLRTFRYDQLNKWTETTFMLPYDPLTGTLIEQ
jgi:RHS repeat-associated protein